MIGKLWNVIQPWPWKIIGIVAGGLILLGLFVFGVNHTIASARKSGLEQGRAEIQAKWDAEKAGRQQARAELSAALTEAFNGLDGSLQNTIRKISADGQTIRVQVEKELKNDPRYSSTECALTGSVLDQINAARGLSGPSTATPVRSGGVPTSGAAVRLEFGDAGAR